MIKEPGVGPKPPVTTEQILVKVVVPATSANLGPGFDCLALALALWNTVTVLPPGPGPRVTATGEGADRLETGDDNLVLRAMQQVADCAGRALPPVRLHLGNAIPFGRGLGSSAAAVVGGLLAGAMVLGLPTAPDALMPLALALESHPDNIAAALWGGLTIGVLGGEAPVVRALPPPPGLSAVLLIPDRFASTVKARAVLDSQVSRADAIFTSSRTALLVADLILGRYDSLAVAMADRLHQPQRARVFAYLGQAIAAALAAGAHGAALSGAGSSVLALTTTRTEEVAAALAEVATRYALPARTLVLEIAAQGAHRVERPVSC